MTKMEMKNRTMTRVPKKEAKEWWNGHLNNSSDTISEKVWEIVQEVPKGEEFYSGDLTDRINEEDGFENTDARRVREKLQRLTEQNKIKFVRHNNIKGSRVKMFERL